MNAASELRNLHETNMDQAEVYCLCGWYGDKQECATDDISGEYECPVCDDEANNCYGDYKELSDGAIRDMISVFSYYVTYLSQTSELRPTLDITGIGERINFMVFSAETVEEPIFGSYNPSENIYYKQWDHLKFRDWINGLANLIETEEEKK